MKAVRWFGRGDVRVVDVPDPAARAGQVVLRVASCGICGTDLEEYRHGPIMIPAGRPHPLTGQAAPLTLGHEFWGRVAEVGCGAEGLSLGQRVVPEVCLACGHCLYCRTGEPARCVRWATLGLHADGGLAEFVAVPAAGCVPLPDTIPDEEGALVEPTEVAVRAVRHGGVRLGETVAVLGAGTIGLLVLQTALAAGATAVHVVEPRPRRRELAMSLGATTAVDPAGTGWQEGLVERCAGLGPHVVFECAGVPGSARDAATLARKGGRVVLIGIAGEVEPLGLHDLVLGEKHVMGSVQHDAEHDLPAALHLLATGAVRAGPLVTTRVSLERAVEDGFHALAGGGDHLKVLVRVGQ